MPTKSTLALVFACVAAGNAVVQAQAESSDSAVEVADTPAKDAGNDKAGATPATSSAPNPNGAPADADHGHAASDAATIATWVSQLDDDRFAARQWAQRRLEAEGLPALDEVARAASGPSLEAASRAIEILMAWAEGEDQALRLRSLHRLAKLKDRPTEAALATEALAEVRQYEALLRIRAAGAKIFADRLSLRLGRREMKLQIVIGPEWEGGEEGLSEIAEIHAAKTLSFHSAPIGESAVPYLLKMHQIERLEFYGTPISQQSQDQLTENMPGLRQPVEVRSAAQLGIEGSINQQGQNGAYVRFVHQDSAAARAGLRDRDLIIEVDGQGVTDFPNLTRRIAAYEPGDTVELVVLRQGKQERLSVTFDRWGEAAHPGGEIVPERMQRLRPSSPAKSPRNDRYWILPNRP